MRPFFATLVLSTVLAAGLLACGAHDTGSISSDMSGDAAADAPAADAADAAAPDTSPTPDAADAAPPLVDATPLPAADAADTSPPSDAAPDTTPAACGSSGSCGARATCVSGSCVTGNRVFVSSTTTNAQFGGPLGADALCQTAATNASLGGTWKAWVAGSQPGEEAPATDFTHGSNYQLVDGTVIGASFGFNPPLHAIDEDENGALVAAAHVWTNTTSAGTSLPDACHDMNSADPTLKAGYGRTDLLGAFNAYPSWSYAGVDTCSTLSRLYCLEQ